MLLAEHVREDHERVMESLQKGDDSEALLTKKTIGLRSDGREFPLEMSISSWRRHGQLFFTTILRDVSERVAAEEARVAAAERLLEAQQRSEMILECAAEGIIGVNLAATIIFTNPAALAILGRSREEMRNCRDTHVLFHHTKTDGTPYPPEECPVLLTLEDGQKRSVTGEVFWRANGEPFAVEYESAPILENGKLAGAVLTFRDVTESQALERQLELAKRIGSLGRVAATIAHEFNNVMMGIEPFAEMIRRRARNDKKILKAANQISISLRRGRRVTEEILRYTQPSEPDLQVIDLREWLRALAPELRALAGSTVGIAISLPDEPAYVACDAAQLQQVVTNLLLNARDASPEGGEVSIALVTTDHDRVEIVVRDSGAGIPPHVLAHVFEPLFTTKRTGTGLGLAVARQIVTRHGGLMEVANAPSGGAEFRVILPATESVPVAAAPARPRQKAKRSYHRLLLVEDDELVAEGLTALLELEGLSVLLIARGLYVIDAVENFAPDAVILDLTLPDIEGVEVFRMLRSRWPQLPILFSTGHGGEVALATELQNERVEMLRKPYEIAELLAALQRITAT